MAKQPHRAVDDDELVWKVMSEEAAERRASKAREDDTGKGCLESVGMALLVILVGVLGWH